VRARIQRPLIVAETSQWHTAGVEARIFARAYGAIPDPIEIPAYDDGPMIEVVPTQAHAAYSIVGGIWRPTSVTAVGRPTFPDDHEVGTLGYTWSDVEEALSMLPPEVGAFIRRN
jgi:hypothetical protein